ncbi:MAG: NADH:flavin oxidoreductase [Proteobacteria bacterium]|nr:NADH:flavin oxidoreductase [Pseudomonadota bacterium]MBU1057927.1 NADH:flavin oxidoreductase [Pseudomonadota bacterium]
MSKLFEESSINGMLLKNRFVRAATWEGLASIEGEVTPELVEMMISLAKGGVGLIISSQSYVALEGQGVPWQLGIYQDELIPKLKEITSAVHENGSKIVMQLSHAGQFAEESLTGRPALAVSDSDDFSGRYVKIITDKDIHHIVASYSQAAKRAQEAGCDGVEIHSAHGCLLSQFLSPTFNKRHDEYGGSVENRTRIHLMIYWSVRKIVGEDYPILIKMNCGDFIEDGMSIDDSLSTAKLFSDTGFDAIELSGGMLRDGQIASSRPEISIVDKEAYFMDYAFRLKKEMNIPLILLGGLRSFEVAEKIITDGIADYIAMSRPFIREPDLVNRWKNGDLRKAECELDNLCFNPGFGGEGIYCVRREKEKKQETQSDI